MPGECPWMRFGKIITTAHVGRFHCRKDEGATMYASRSRIDPLGAWSSLEACYRRCRQRGAYVIKETERNFRSALTIYLRSPSSIVHYESLVWAHRHSIHSTSPRLEGPYLVYNARNQHPPSHSSCILVPGLCPIKRSLGVLVSQR